MYTKACTNGTATLIFDIAVGQRDSAVTMQSGDLWLFISTAGVSLSEALASRVTRGEDYLTEDVATLLMGVTMILAVRVNQWRPLRWVATWLRCYDELGPVVVAAVALRLTRRALRLAQETRWRETRGALQ